MASTTLEHIGRDLPDGLLWTIQSTKKKCMFFVVLQPSGHHYGIANRHVQSRHFRPPFLPNPIFHTSCNQTLTKLEPAEMLLRRWHCAYHPESSNSRQCRQRPNGRSRHFPCRTTFHWLQPKVKIQEIILHKIFLKTVSRL